MIYWHEGLTTGVPDLDDHHREIFSKFNEFYAAMSRGPSAKLDEAGKILDYLQFYAQLHFKREEEIMEKYHCPAAEENKRAHAQFLRDFGAFYTQWQTGGMDLALANDTFVKMMEWIVNHIEGVDTELRKCVTPTIKT
jgi:hemerythrin